MKWVLINKFDEIVDTCEIASGVGVSGATTYFRKRKQMEEKDFDNLWKVMSKDHYIRISEVSKRDGKQYEWWKDESTNPDEGFDY